MASQTKFARRAVVTGASSGIGLAFAERLAHDGYDLTISARNRERLSALDERLERECGVTVEVCVADLTTPEGQAAVADTIARADNLEFLINNAGFVPPASFLETPPDALEAMVDVHITATVKLTRAALPGMVTRGRGTVINVSSVAGFLAGAGLYGSTKAFLITFTQGLHDAVHKRGVRLQALCPGYTRTEIFERIGKPFPAPDSATMPPEELVDVSLASLELGEVVCVPTLEDITALDRIAQLKQQIFDQATALGKSAARYRRRM